MRAPVRAFKYRPLGDHPVSSRRQAMEELDQPWSRGQVRLLSPPTDLITPTIVKLRQTRAPAVLLIPDWPRQQWHQAAMQLATSVTRLPYPADMAFEGFRTINPKWQMLMLEVNNQTALMSSPILPPSTSNMSPAPPRQPTVRALI